MAKKHEKKEVKPHITRRQLSRHRRQQRIQHIIYITGAVFLASIICFIGYGFWDAQIRPFRQPVAKINGTTYDMGYYLKMLDLYSKGQDATQTMSTANNLIQVMEYNQALNKAAPELGITVSSDEINNVLKAASLPDEKVNRDAAAAVLLTNKLKVDYFDKEVPTSIEQAHTQALLVESTDIAEKAAARLSATDNFTALANEFSLEPITKQYGGDLGWLPKGYTNILLGNLGNSKLKDIPFTLEPGVLSQPTFDGVVKKSLGYWVVQVTEKDPTRGSHVRGILTGSRHDADAIRAKIVAGEDFATLVKTYSQDTANSDNVGDMGWTQEGAITSRLVLGLAMPLDTGAVSQPAADSSVATVGGFWLIRVLEKDENRVLDDTTRQAITTGLFENWITDKMKNDSVETIITEDKKAWAIDIVNKSRGQ
ncbi:MAG: peptidylprolyl isomerase [Dehalococcoidia bacterium]|nr:peptidylprolyl isomerase [Dehalococcoidia bacterium]